MKEIQKVFRSQGVEIHNRHIEIIVRQITSKVLVSEDGMSKVFSPGELIGLLRAEVRTNTETPFFYALLVIQADHFVCNEKEREGSCRSRVFTGNESGRASETFEICQA